jgi:hypothetical protein
LINKSLKVSKCSPVTALSILSGNTASGRSRPSYGSEHYTPTLRLGGAGGLDGGGLAVSYVLRSLNMNQLTADLNKLGGFFFSRTATDDLGQRGGYFSQGFIFSQCPARERSHMEAMKGLFLPRVIFPFFCGLRLKR